MKIIAIIPARGGSKGIKGKNLIKFCGKPLIAWSILQAKASKYINDVYVTSDNDKILSISEGFGADTIKRPKQISTDTSPVEIALEHAIYNIEKINKDRIDLIVFLQATSPVRESTDIDKAIKLFILKKPDSLFSAGILEDCCIWKKKGTELKSITFNYRKRGCRQDRAPVYLENGSIYIFKPSILKRYKNRLGGRIIIYPMPLWKSYEIDSMQDLEICTYYMKKKILHKEI